MSELGVILALICTPTVMINKTTFKWNDWDYSRRTYCHTRCVYYYPDDPCLKTFVKVTERGYYCECGKVISK